MPESFPCPCWNWRCISQAVECSLTLPNTMLHVGYRVSCWAIKPGFQSHSASSACILSSLCPQQSQPLRSGPLMPDSQQQKYLCCFLSSPCLCLGLPQPQYEWHTALEKQGNLLKTHLSSKTTFFLGQDGAKQPVAAKLISLWKGRDKNNFSH